MMLRPKPPVRIMAANNQSIIKRIKEPNDEYYTQKPDIEAELSHYSLQGLNVYCPCDDWRSSAFASYLAGNFKALGLRGLKCSHYSPQSQPSLLNLNPPAAPPAHLASFDGEGWQVEELAGDGSFDSPELLEAWKWADLIITNPPFSLFRRFFSLCLESGKQFLFLSPLYNYIEVNCLPRFGREFWFGYSRQPSRQFQTPSNELKTVPLVVWWTNLPVDETKIPELKKPPFEWAKPVTQYPRTPDGLLVVDKCAELPPFNFPEPFYAPGTIALKFPLSSLSYFKIERSLLGNRYSRLLVQWKKQ